MKTDVETRARQAAARAHPVPQPCEECGESDTTLLERHHDDYHKPLEIRWLCRRHHHEAHNPNASGKEGGNFTIYVTGKLYQDVKRLGRRINKSAVCSEALAAAVERIDRMTH